MKKFLIILISILLFVMIGTLGYGYYLENFTQTVEETFLQSTQSKIEKVTRDIKITESIFTEKLVEVTAEEEFEDKYATITAIGDLMFHLQQLKRAYDTTTGKFDFSESFKYIKKYLNKSDYTIGNLETTFAGYGNGMTNEFYGYCGYPQFNTPEVLAQNLKDIGFDLLGTANNHSLDSGIDGVYKTIDELEKVGILNVGTYKSEKKSKKSTIVDINGILFGFCAYTNTTNGLSVNEDYALNNLYYYDENAIKMMCEKVKKLKDEGADIVIVMVHFGEEYYKYQDNNQERVVDKLFEAGADVILGSHPHVIQPLDIREIEDSDGVKRKKVVIYSLGNFISSQRYNQESGADKDIGLILDLSFKKTAAGTEIQRIDLVPTYSYWTNEVIGVLPVCEVADNISNYSDILSDYDKKRIEIAKDNTILHVLKYVSYPYKYKNNKYRILLKNGLTN